MAVDKLSDEDLERLRKAADVAAMKARAAVEGSLSKAVDDTTQALVDARGAEEKAKAGFFAAEAEVKEAVKTLEWEQGCVATRTYPDAEPPGCIRHTLAHPCYLGFTSTTTQLWPLPRQKLWPTDQAMQDRLLKEHKEAVGAAKSAVEFAKVTVQESVLAATEAASAAKDARAKKAKAEGT